MERTSVRYVAVGSYDGPYRDIARGVVAGHHESIRLAAAALAAVLPRGAVLVPVPSRNGHARETLALCRVLETLYRFKCCDCLEGTPRDSLRELKHKERDRGLAPGSLMPEPDALGIRLRKGATAPHEPVLIDNVVASGTTALAAASAIPDALLFCIANDRTYPKRDGVLDFTETYAEEKSTRCFFSEMSNNG